MKPRYRIKELHLRNGETRYVPQGRHWIFWQDLPDLFGNSQWFSELSDAQDFLRKVERLDGLEVVGTSYINYEGGSNDN